MVMQSELDGNENIMPDTWYLAVETKGAKVRAGLYTPLCHPSSFHCPTCYFPKSSGHSGVCAVLNAFKICEWYSAYSKIFLGCGGEAKPGRCADPGPMSCELRAWRARGHHGVWLNKYLKGRSCFTSLTFKSCLFALSGVDTDGRWDVNARCGCYNNLSSVLLGLLCCGVDCTHVVVASRGWSPGCFLWVQDASPCFLVQVL